MSGQESIDSHIQLLIDMDEPINAQDRMIVWAAQRIESLEAELEDTVTECLAAKSNEDILRKQLAELREAVLSANQQADISSSVVKVPYGAWKKAVALLQERVE